MYTASVSTGSVKTSSVKGAPTGRGLRPWVPAMWRRVALIVRSRSQQSMEDGSESSLQEFLDVDQSVQEDHMISGALPNNGLCRDNPQRPSCLTDSCSRYERNGVNFQPRPLPRPPDLVATPAESLGSISPFNISPKISAFSREVETRFLAPLERQVLQSIHWLSETPISPANVLVRLGVDEFWMSRRDADTLERIMLLTEVLSREEREILLGDLDPLLKPEYKYPLKQVLLYGVNIISMSRQTLLVGDNESLIDLYSDIDDNDSSFDDATAHLVPAPLRIRSKTRRGFHGPSHRPHRLSRLIELSEPNTPLSSNLPLPSDEGEQKQPGSVSRARARLLKARAAAAEQSRQFNGAQLLEVTESQGEDEQKRPGSVSNARRNLFMNPRPAPKPPVSIVRPASKKQMENIPKNPGSVSRARIAAQNALSPDINKTSIEQASGTAPTATIAPKAAGSIRRARENLAHRSGDDQVFPVRTSSLPHLPLAQRPANLRAGRFSTDRPQFARESAIDVVVRPLTAAETPSVPPKDPDSDVFTLFRPSSDPVRHEKVDASMKSAILSDTKLYDDERDNTNVGGNVLENSLLIRSGSTHLPKPSHSASSTISAKLVVDMNNFCALHPHSHSGLRGGGGDTTIKPTLKRRISTLLGNEISVLANNERPPQALWWLAGGRSGRSWRKRGKARLVPTAGELRERRKVEEANREVVGYIGTVFGVRAVRRLPVEPEGEGDGENDE